MKSVNILGITIHDISRAEALARAQACVADGFQHYIVTPNPEIVLQSQKDSKLRFILNHANLALPDGIGLKIAARVLGQRLAHRLAGADFMESLCACAEAEGWPIFLLGGRDEKVAEKAAWRMRYLYKRIKVVGHASGGIVEFTEGRWRASDEKLFKKITTSGALVLLVGFGCPKQEQWIFQNLDKLPNVRLAMTVGGTLDYLSGTKKRAPRFVRKSGLEWLWRLCLEPSRARRIWNATAAFLWTVIQWRVRMSVQYRRNVAGFIANRNNEVLLVQRANEKDVHWQLPQGGVDRNESDEEAVLREMREETGLTDLEIIGVNPQRYTYGWPRWHRLKGGYRGQTQTIFYLRTQSEPNAVRPDPHEISHYAWVYVDDVIENVHEKRKGMTSMAVAGYRQVL